LGSGQSITTVDHFGINARLHGFQDVSTGQVDRGSRIPVEIDLSSMSRDQSSHDDRYFAAGQIVSLHGFGRDCSEPRLDGHNLAVDDHVRIDLPQRHENQLEGAHLSPRHIAA